MYPKGIRVVAETLWEMRHRFTRTRLQLLPLLLPLLLPSFPRWHQHVFPKP
jgi:hypothetical protein